MDQAREQVEEKEEGANSGQIRLFKNLPWEGHFSLLPPCLSEIGWIKSSLKEKQGTNLGKMNLNSKKNFIFFNSKKEHK